MIPFFPKQIAQRAIIVYISSLVIVSILFFNHSMSWGYIALGITWVAGFFFLSSTLSNSWRKIDETSYVKNLFFVAIVLRLAWVFASYFYYLHTTGTPFEFGAADSLGYHDEASWLASEQWSTVWNYYFGPFSNGISDAGYPLYLTLLYKLFGPIIIIPRIIKAIIGTFTCYLLYRLASRSFGEQIGRMTGIMAALMPNLIIYCGYHLKETEMIFLEVAFLERMDYLLRAKKWNFVNIVIPILLAGLLFFFRTVLGAAAVFAFVTAILVSNTPTMKRGWKRTAIIGWGLMTLVIASEGTAVTEIEALWEQRDENQVRKRTEQTSRGNQWAKYATGTVMAPMALVLPFSTMVNVDEQYSQQEKHGGNYIRNFMGFFALLAVYEALRRKQWRDFALIGALTISYLGVVSLSGFSNSERFLLPALPGLILMWAYGISTLRAQSYRLLNPWCVLVILMEFGWAFFKLGSRGFFS